MRLKEYIKNLQEIAKQNDELEVIYSHDDEGNCFQPVFNKPTPVSITIDNIYKQYLESEDLDFEPKTPNAIIIN